MLSGVGAILKELGLNSVETRVFIASLEIGSGAASTIAHTAGVNRITAYEALKRLSKKGLMKIRAKKNTKVKYFVPEDISAIKTKLEEKKADLEKTIVNIDSLKHEFKALYAFSEQKPTVFFYEGSDGVKTVIEDTLKVAPEEILSFASAESIETGFDQNFLDTYWKNRTSLGIPTKGIMPKTEKAQRWFSVEKNRSELRQVKFIPKEVYDYKNHIDIYEDNIAIASLSKGNEYGIIIRSQSVAESMRAVFKALWELAS